ncbi:hypothetical protein TWF569_006104 [Orbilia oligospora]|nr:hypothetical protein TWF569_006104 [Orbilia oligospora]
MQVHAGVTIHGMKVVNLDEISFYSSRSSGFDFLMDWRDWREVFEVKIGLEMFRISVGGLECQRTLCCILLRQRNIGILKRRCRQRASSILESWDILKIDGVLDEFAAATRDGCTVESMLVSSCVSRWSFFLQL